MISIFLGKTIRFGNYLYFVTVKITFNKNGTAQFTLNGEEKTYKFAFVNYEWSKRWLRNPIEGYYALIVYENTNAIYVFDIEDSNTIWFGEYEFVAM